MSRQFDIAIIGTGSAATGVALSCAKHARVAVIDHRPYGGTCALRGCDPKKVLAGATGAADLADRLAAVGALDGKIAVQWPGLSAFTRRFTDPVPSNREDMFRDAGIETLHGKARFTGADSVRVGEEEIRAAHIVIATGSEPVPLPVDGATLLSTSDDFLAMDRLPERIVLVGGGYIGFEFAHIAALAGARVTLLNRGDRVLKGFDPDLVALLLKRSEALGVEVYLGHELTAVRDADGEMHVTARHQGRQQNFVADRVFHSGGRVPAVADLDLDAGGVAHEGRTLLLNEYLQSTSNPRVYAAGDAAPGSYPLTPVAGLEAEVVAENLIHGNQNRVRYGAIPTGCSPAPCWRGWAHWSRR